MATLNYYLLCAAPQMTEKAFGEKITTLSAGNSFFSHFCQCNVLKKNYSPTPDCCTLQKRKTLIQYMKNYRGIKCAVPLSGWLLFCMMNTIMTIKGTRINMKCTTPADGKRKRKKLQSNQSVHTVVLRKYQRLSNRPTDAVVPKPDMQQI